MRLFLAIDFNELKEYFSELQKNIDNSSAKLKEVSTFHLTIKFLGDVPDNQVDLIKERLKNIKFRPFSLTLDKIGVFPNESHIGVVWVGLKPRESVIELQNKIEETLKEFKFKKDFKFHPHITLARVKFVEEKEKFVKNLKDMGVENKQMEIKDFRLVKSSLTPKGPVYEDLEVFNFS